MDSFSKFMGEIAAEPKPATMTPSVKASPVAWKVSKGLTDYEQAVSRMEAIVSAIQLGQEPEQVWLVEHPSLYTAGTSAKAEDLLMPDRFPVFKTGRGGEFTYHGPGQRVAYVMLDLKRRTPDVRAFVNALEQWVIMTLADFNVQAERRRGRIGVWVERPDKPGPPDGRPREDKIAAIGIRLRRWVSFHGVAINVNCDPGNFSGIVPCGISGHGVTSLADLGLSVEMADLDQALKRNFTKLFGEVER